MSEKRKHKGLTRRVNEAGKGYFDIWYKGTHTRLYTGRPHTSDHVVWFDARETLLAEMLENDTFEIEKARAVLGIASQRQKRTAQQVDLTIQEFGEEWLERKKTAVGEAKVQEYRERPSRSSVVWRWDRRPSTPGRSHSGLAPFRYASCGRSMWTGSRTPSGGARASRDRP